MKKGYKVTVPIKAGSKPAVTAPIGGIKKGYKGKKMPPLPPKFGKK